ncbi:hypothetical protein KJ909_03265 [Patescibacteria group bacterium]|nr:hypothetical protein [Patescibacteria group bacterium]
MIILFFLLLFLFPQKIFASDEFLSNQQISYNIDENGQASVTQKITLTNNYSEIYAKEYQVVLSGTDIKNITGQDQKGNIIKNVDQQQEETYINLIFNQAIVGKDKSLEFTLNYIIPALAQKKGKTWEVHLPSHQSDNSQNNLAIKVIVPEKLGKLSFSSVSRPRLSTFNAKHQIDLNNQQISHQKILLIFGDYQVFDFSLNYFLENPSSQKIISSIPLPPDTNSQKVSYRQILPPPQNVTLDQDGNWLAQYEISPDQELNIVADGQVKITSPLVSTSSNPDLSGLTSTQPYWPVNHPQIQTIAQSLKNSQDIYNYVVSHLSYNYQIISSSQRQGALFALENPTLSLCTEFTDLFITLARAKNIPAREVEGYAYTNNPKIKPTNPDADILHAWPQYFDQNKKTWVSVDPTWGKTTNGIDYYNDLDLNHFAFVFHGQNSSYPPPPGSYKNNHQTKTVKVDFSNTEIKNESQNLKISLLNKKIIVANPNLHSLNHVEIRLPLYKWTQNIFQIPPLAQISFNLPSLPFWKNFLPQYQKLNFHIISDENSFSQSLPLPDFRYNLLLTLTALIFIASISGIIFHLFKKNHA